MSIITILQLVLFLFLSIVLSLYVSSTNNSRIGQFSIIIMFSYTILAWVSTIVWLLFTKIYVPAEIITNPLWIGPISLVASIALTHLFNLWDDSVPEEETLEYVVEIEVYVSMKEKVLNVLTIVFAIVLFLLLFYQFDAGNDWVGAYALQCIFAVLIMIVLSLLAMSKKKVWVEA